MNRRPGQVRVTTEVAYCSFCGRPRNLRREEHQLGTLVRTIVTCETCHRTLSSTMGVAAEEPKAEEQAEAAAPEAVEEAPKPARKTARKPAAKSTATSTRAKPKAKASPKRTTPKK